MGDSSLWYQLESYVGVSRIMLGDEKGFEAVFNKIDGYCRRNPSDCEVAGLYWNHRAVIAQNYGLRDSAAACYHRAYDNIGKSRNGGRLIDVSINLGNVYMQSGKLPESANAYRRAMFLADSLNEHTADFSILTGLGCVYSDLGDYGLAAGFFAEARPLVAQALDYDAFFYFNSVGNSLYLQNRFADAAKAFRQARRYAIRCQQANLQVITETNLGECLMMGGQVDSAQYYLKRSEKGFAQLPNVDESQRFYMASLLADLALHENNLPEARRYFSSIKVDTATTMPKYIALHFERLRRFYERQGDWRQAYQASRLSTRFNDTLTNQQSKNQIAELEYRYRQDTTLLQSRLAVGQKQEEVNELHITIYVMILLLVVALLLTAVFIMMRRKKRLAAELKMRDSLFSLRMENIRNRISPHFVFNVLNREMDSSSPGVVNLVNLLRKNLELCDRYVVSLQDELDFINTYIDTERDSLGDNFTYDCNVADDVDCSAISIPSMMIQIFVENAVKHGLRGFDGDKYLRIDMCRKNNNLELNIRNNGHAFGRRDASKSTGTGLRIVTQTIQILNERNVNKITLKFGQDKDADNSTAWNVAISIPDGYDFSRIQK